MCIILGSSAELNEVPLDPPVNTRAGLRSGNETKIVGDKRPDIDKDGKMAYNTCHHV